LTRRNNVCINTPLGGYDDDDDDDDDDSESPSGNVADVINHTHTA